MSPKILFPIEFQSTGLKRTAAFLFLLVAFALRSEAQIAFVKIDEIKIECDSIHKTITIDFNAPSAVANLLVHINDSQGRTVFLDNKYNFSGNYKKSVELKTQGNGIYSVEIIEDNKHINKKIEIR